MDVKSLLVSFFFGSEKINSLKSITLTTGAKLDFKVYMDIT